MKPADKVVVVQSWSSDVNAGGEGVVVKRMRGGYAVNITGLFTDAVGHRQVGTRCMFFAAKELRQIDPATTVRDAKD